MNQTLLSSFGTPFERVENALAALREGRGVMVLDDEDRENEGDMIFPAETIVPVSYTHLDVYKRQMQDVNSASLSMRKFH
ncbi:3,4-dihydroxy-2-butanone 4-phosphate synthase [Escherichia coli]|nr:3,4-dihydroxy-2-butanone 4-phosphate synthase [Escherichia coli]